jgi:hypothetical protein
MDLRAEILKENSKENAELIAAWIGEEPSRMQQFMHIFLHDEYRVVQLAAHVLGKIDDKHPELIEQHIDDLVKRMTDKAVHVAVKRNVVRVLQNIPIPERLHGDVMNICFDLLADIKETVAVRVFSMTILDNLSRHYPEIRQELKVILEDQLEQGCTAGFRSRASKILKGK